MLFREKPNADAAWTFVVDLVWELWKLPRKKRDLVRLHTKWQWSVCFLTVHRKAPTKGTIRTGNGGFPCGIDGLRELLTDTDLPSQIL